MSPNQSAKSEVIGSLVKTTAAVDHRGNELLRNNHGSNHVSKLGNRWSVIGTEQNITEKTNQEYFVN